MQAAGAVLAGLDLASVVGIVIAKNGMRLLLCTASLDGLCSSLYSVQ